MNQPRATLAAGMQVTPSVRLLSPLGAGGMGAVWLADHTALNTRVVVKFMLGGLDSSASARARFKREAEAASQVKSPHVVQTFDYGLTADDVPFIVMEYLEGRDLAVEIAAQGALDPARVVAIVTQVSRALSKAHGAGLLHRDIKPDNIFLCQHEAEDELFVKLLDFGIAKSHAGEAGEITLDGQTKTGQVVGTPFYMSPEQVTAQKVIDLRSDLWALGIVAFEALTGKRPFDGPSFGALAVKIATGEPPRPSEYNAALPPSVDAWFAQACAREPAARFSSARELADRFRAAFDGVVSLPPLPPAMSDSGARSATSGEGQPAGGPISVDEDANARASFVLASTVNEQSPRSDERSSLARSDGGAAMASSANEEARREGQGRSRRVLGALLGALAVAASIGVALRWAGKDRGGGPAEAPSAGVAATASFRAAPSAARVMPSEKASLPASAGASASAVPAAATGAEAASAASAAGAEAGSAPAASSGADAGSATSASARDAAALPVPVTPATTPRAHASAVPSHPATSIPTRADPAPKPSVHPVAPAPPGHDDPLF